MKIKKQKKAQEEMIGFVVIMVLVIVILLIFLLIYMGNNESEKSDSKVENFVKILPSYTTDCGKNGDPHMTIKEVATYCYQNKECLNGEDSCEYLEDTVKKIMEETWQVGEGFYYKAYSLRFYEKGDEILLIEEGNKEGATQGFSNPTGVDDTEITLVIYR